MTRQEIDNLDQIWDIMNQSDEAKKAVFSSARALMSQIKKIEAAADKVQSCCNCRIQGLSLRDGFCAMCD